MIALLLMAGLTFAPLEDAVRFHGAKTPVGAALRSAEWEQVAVGLRNRAQFTAGVENIRVPALIQERIGRILAHARNANGALTDRSGFLRDLAALAEELGLRPEDGRRGGLQDLGSVARTELIYQQQVGQAYCFADWKSGQDPDALDAAPAQELVRIREALQPRDWLTRWQGAGGRLFGGRMIALKSDPIWTRISRFGTPWPPFDFNSGMWVEDVLRPEAEALGVIRPGVRVPPSPARVDDFLTVNVTTWTDAERARLQEQFGDQVVLGRNQARWQGNLIAQFVEDVLDGRPRRDALRLGGPSSRARQLALAAGVDLSDTKLLLEVGHVRKTWRDHGPDSSDATPITRLDYELVPHVWREPDAIRRSQDTVVFEKELMNRTLLVTWQVRAPGNPRWTMQSLYKTKAAVLRPHGQTAGNSARFSQPDQPNAEAPGGQR